MHIRRSTTVALGLSGLLLVACSDNEGNDTSGESIHLDASSPIPDGALGQSGPEVGTDAILGCCPTGFVLYSCSLPGDGGGFACHNPAMGCPSSSTCGAGCDPQVSGRCACVETQLCIRGDHFDTDLCKCVPDLDASARAAEDAACIENVLCIGGDHFDSTLCKCVPNFAGGPAR